ncbi:MAG: hypothetical protein ABSG79_22420 [Bryobacteraceae bacterium]|jgi:hypothetical protein
MGGKQFEADERGKAIFGEFIRAARPDAQLSWGHEAARQIHIAFIQRPGKKRIYIEISQEAFDEATVDRESRLRLEREVERQLRLSESGKGMGLVKEGR